MARSYFKIGGGARGRPDAVATVLGSPRLGRL
jgi:hypothetical protein